MPINEKPLVTVITVCHNLYTNKRTDCFRQCVHSVHGQDYHCIEHLVIDGGSADGTVSLLEEYAQLGWIRFISERDSGIYDAMNKGMRLAQGKYIAFLNSDDFWHRKEAVSASVAALERSGATFSYAPRTLINEDGSFYCTEAAGLGVFPCLMPFCHQTMFTRRDALLRMNGFDDVHYRSAADYDLVLRLLLSGEQGVYVPLNFTSFRMGGFSAADSLSRQECDRSRLTLLGEKAAGLLYQGQMDDDLMQRIMGRVHPQTALDLLRCFVRSSPGVYQLAYGLVRNYPSSQKHVVTGIAPKQNSIYRLFNILPVLQRKQRPSRVDWLLFACLPLLRVRRFCNSTRLYFLFVIPLVTIRQYCRCQ